MSVRSTDLASPFFDRFLRTQDQGTNASSLGLTATGGVVSDYTDGGTVYRSHVFTSSGTFEVTAPGTFGDTVEYLVVAGGGGGGSWVGGGGGGGGVLHNPSYDVTVGPYSITVGAGGQGGINPGNNIVSADASPGSNSIFAGISTADGGGRGGSYDKSTSLGGGSGGGGGNSPESPSPTPTAGGTASQSPSGGATGYGNNGGAATGPPQY